MFRKIVSNLAFSPALVGQLGFYAKRLRKEEATRRIGLIFTVLALIVQSFAVFQPPEAANASSPADFVPGGVSSVSDFLKSYDKNSRNIKSVFSSLGITRDEIKAAKSGTVDKSGHYNWSMTSLYSYKKGQRSYKFYNSNGSSGTVYNRPMALTQEGRAPYPSYIGHSKKFGWFAIKKDCGNLITTKQPPSEKAPASKCKDLSATLTNRTTVRLQAVGQRSGDAVIKGYTFTIKDASGKTVKTKKITTSSTKADYTYQLTVAGDYTAKVVVHTSIGDRKATNCAVSFTIETPSDVNKTKAASNLTQDKDAAAVLGMASDKIAYTITAENKGGVTAPFTFKEELDDVLEYAKVIDNGGGTFDAKTNTLTWSTVDLNKGEKQSRTFVVRLDKKIAATNTGTSNPDSYNCVITNTFGNSVEVKINCPTQKVVVEQVVSELPTTGPTENMIFAGGLLAVVAYFYARSRQVNKEIRLIRRDAHAGTI